MYRPDQIGRDGGTASPSQVSNATTPPAVPPGDHHATCECQDVDRSVAVCRIDGDHGAQDQQSDFGDAMRRGPLVRVDEGDHGTSFRMWVTDQEMPAVVVRKGAQASLMRP